MNSAPGFQAGAWKDGERRVFGIPGHRPAVTRRLQGRAGRPAPAPFPCGGLHLAGGRGASSKAQEVAALGPCLRMPGSVRDTGIRRGRPQRKGKFWEPS